MTHQPPYEATAPGDRAAAAFAALVARCRRRSYREEGIPAMLVLEDARSPRATDEAEPDGTELDQTLASALELYGRLVREPAGPVGAAELAVMLEALATRFFFAGDLPDLPPADPEPAG